jgi:hypothetical protein
MQYRSKSSLIGLPLVHIAIGPAPGSRSPRGVARGWIAIGDIAFGVLFSAGGVAIGGIALGGLAIGGICLCGLGFAVYALGGGAFGIYSIGGLAFGWHAAIGGAAIAKKYAVGGYAVAEHANDPVAMEYMKTSVMRYGELVAQHARWFIVLAFLPAVIGIYKLWKSSQEKD